MLEGETPYLGDLLPMVINNFGMILQVKPRQEVFQIFRQCRRRDLSKNAPRDGARLRNPLSRDDKRRQ